MRKALYAAMAVVVWREQHLYNVLYLIDGLIGVQVLSKRACSFEWLHVNDCMCPMTRWTYGIISIIETFLRFSL